MLSFPTIFRRALLFTVSALVADGAIAFTLTWLNYPIAEVMGDFMLVEAAGFFIIAGLMDFSASLGAVQFQRVVLRSKREYSAAAHKDYARKALAFLMAGLILLGILVAVAVYYFS
jgi:UPF0716 family protein affecting phage T7 exclusion